MDHIIKEDTEDESKIHRHKRTKLYVMVFILLAMVIICVYYFTSKEDKNDNQKYGNTNGNIANIGLVCEKNGNIYYTKGGRIYLSDSYGKNIKLIYDSNNSSIEYINVVDNYIFYSSKGGIHRINIDGTNGKIISNNATGSFYYDGWLYYIGYSEGYSKQSIYRTDVDGLQKYEICEYEISSGTIYVHPSIYDDYIYYKSKEGLFSIKFDGSNNKNITHDTPAVFVISRGWIYYSTYDFELYRITIDGEEKQKLSNNVTRFNIEKDWIYYFHSEGDGIYRVNTDGKNNKKLNKNTAMNIFTTKNDIIYWPGYYKMNFDGSNNTEFLTSK